MSHHMGLAVYCWKAMSIWPVSGIYLSSCDLSMKLTRKFCFKQGWTESRTPYGVARSKLLPMAQCISSIYYIHNEWQWSIFFGTAASPHEKTDRQTGRQTNKQKYMLYLVNKDASGINAPQPLFFKRNYNVDQRDRSVDTTVATI